MVVTQSNHIEVVRLIKSKTASSRFLKDIIGLS